MDESSSKKKPKKKIDNIIFWTIVILLFLYMFFRTEIQLDSEPCSKCSIPEDCEKQCIKFCLIRITDIVTTIGYSNSSGIYCGCKCNSNLHTIADTFL